MEGTGHSFIYGDHDEILRLGRKVALPAVRCLSEVSPHGWSRPNSCGDPLEALTDWVYIIYEVGLQTGDPELRRYYRFLVPFSADECPSVSDDELRTFDGGSGVSKAEFGRPLLWKLLWGAAIRRELAFSKLGTDLVHASKTALDHLLDTGLGTVESDVSASIPFLGAGSETRGAQPALARHPEDPYAWCRQADTVKAINQVCGYGELNRGVFSKAVSAVEIKGNGKSGRASRVSVDSVLAWVEKKFGLAYPEVEQVRNAIIGEIRKRNK